MGRSVRAFAEQLDMLLTNSESNRVRDAAFAVLCELMLVFDSKKLRVCIFSKLASACGIEGIVLSQRSMAH